MKHNIPPWYIPDGDHYLGETETYRAVTVYGERVTHEWPARLVRALDNHHTMFPPDPGVTDERPGNRSHDGELRCKKCMTTGADLETKECPARPRNRTTTSYELRN